MNDEEKRQLSILTDRGRSIVASIEQEIGGQAFLKSAEVFGKLLTMDLEKTDRDFLWTVGGTTKGMLPDPIERVLEQFVDWYMNCVLFFRQMGWASEPHVVQFKEARNELSLELLRANPSLSVALRIVNRQVQSLDFLLHNPPELVEKPAEVDKEQTGIMEMRVLAIVVYIAVCLVLDSLIAVFAPDFLLWFIGSEIALPPILLKLWSWVKSGT